VLVVLLFVPLWFTFSLRDEIEVGVSVFFLIFVSWSFYFLD
jgi:hypothetical protein